jgi:hypothetical protein
MKSGDLGRIGIDTGHAMAEIGETGSRDQPDIARPDHRYPHCSVRLMVNGRLTNSFAS